MRIPVSYCKDGRRPEYVDHGGDKTAVKSGMMIAVNSSEDVDWAIVVWPDGTIRGVVLGDLMLDAPYSEVFSDRPESTRTRHLGV